MIKLYHFTNADISGKLKPCHFGENSYTNGGIKASSIKRLYFYTVNRAYESHLKDCRFCYIVEVENSKIYDLDIDINEYKIKEYTPSQIFFDILKRGYIGIKFNLGFYDIVNIFKPIKFIEKYNLQY